MRNLLSARLQGRREARARVDRDAHDLLTFMGEPAYYEARERARACRVKRDRAGDRHWTRVAVEIAKQTGHRIGERSADRYAADAPSPPQPPMSRGAITSALVDIAEAIAALSRGRATETTLHNAEAAALRAAALSRAPEAEQAGLDVQRALRELAAVPDENAAALSAGCYPPRADAAGEALVRFRAVVLAGVGASARS